MNPYKLDPEKRICCNACCYEQGYSAGIALERARVVAWLRTRPECLRADATTIYGPYEDAAQMLADALENDDATHARGEGK
jgi:hypothetical protein